jgi:hypothetical protein
LIKTEFLRRLLFNFERLHHLLLKLKVQSPLLFKHLRILNSLIIKSAAYRGAFKKERFLAVRYLTFNILKKRRRWQWIRTSFFNKKSRVYGPKMSGRLRNGQEGVLH